MSSPPSPLAAPLPWDLVATDYAREIVPHFERYARDALRLAAPRARARILDVACGPGTLTLLAAAEAEQVTAIDFSPEMIGRLRARLAERGLGNVEARIGDGQALPLPDASFDAAFSMFGLMFFPDRDRGLREIRRVLVPGGRVAIGSWLPLSEVPLLAAVLTTMREGLLRVWKTGDLPIGDPHPPLGTEEAMRTELAAAGFHDVEAHRVEHSWAFPDAAAFSATMRRTLAPLVLLRHELGAEGFRPIDDAIDARIAEVAGPGPAQVTMPAWIGVGTA